MNTPVHHIKRHIVYADNHERDHWSTDSVQGFLGSRILDHKGKEIFEDDIVEEEDTGKRHRVYFVNGGFMIHDFYGYHLLTNFPYPLEVVGHAED